MAYKVDFKAVGKDLKKMLDRYTDFKSQKAIADEASEKWLEAARASAPMRTGKLRRGIKARKPKLQKTAKKAVWIFELYFSNRGNPAVSSYGESLEKGGRHQAQDRPYLVPVNDFKDKRITARQFLTKPRSGFIFARYKSGIGVLGMVKGKSIGRGLRSRNKAKLLFREIKSFSHKGTNFITKNQEVPIKYMMKAFREMNNG